MRNRFCLACEGDGAPGDHDFSDWLAGRSGYSWASCGGCGWHLFDDAGRSCCARHDGGPAAPTRDAACAACLDHHSNVALATPAAPTAARTLRRTVAARQLGRAPTLAHPASAQTVELRYSTASPCAVELLADLPEGRVEAVFARSLLAEGLRRHSGVGAVRLAPRGRHLAVEVDDRRPAGNTTAALVLPRREVESFLEDSAAMLPPACEADQLKLDDVVARLLAHRESGS